MDAYKVTIDSIVSISSSIYLKCVRQLLLGNAELPIWVTRINVPFLVDNNGQSDSSIVY